MPAAVNVRGLREFEILAKTMGKEANRKVRAGLRDVAEPVRHDVEQLAQTEISHMSTKHGRRPDGKQYKQWWRMRIGVTQKLVYVAPKERGVKVRGPDPRRRPQFLNTMFEKAMDPALARNKALIDAGLTKVLTEFAADWNRR